jgi:hypothetical protein
VLAIDVNGEDKNSIKSMLSGGLQEFFGMEHVLKINKQYLELLK